MTTLTSEFNGILQCSYSDYDMLVSWQEGHLALLHQQFSKVFLIGRPSGDLV